MKPSSGGGDWELPPAGNMAAVCVALIDLGTQQDAYMGKPKDSHQLVIVWELVGMVNKTGKNHLVCEKFNASLHPKANLRKTLESWRGKPIKDDEDFDVFKIVGAPCLLQVSHDKTNSGNDVYCVDAVTNLPRGMQAPKATYPLVRYKIEDGPEEIPKAEWLPALYGKKIADVVAGCIEFRTKAPAAAAPGPDGAKRPEPEPPTEADIPF
jgi:hypothetical protein